MRKFVLAIKRIMQQDKSRRFSAKNVIQYVLMLALACVLLYYSFKGISWGEFVNSLSDCKWGWILLAIFVGFLEFSIRGYRWKMMLSQIDPESSFWPSYHGVTIGNLANFAFPRVGEVIRCGVVSTLKKNTTFEGAVGTVVAERAWDLICLITITIVFAALCWNEFGEFFRNNMMDPASGKFTTSSLIVIFSVLAAIVLAFVLTYVFRDRLSKTKAGKKVVGFLSNMWKGMKAAFKMKHKWLFFLLTILLWGSFFLTSLFTIKAFPVLAGLGWKDALFLMVVGSLGWVVPVQGGIGAYHFIMALAASQIYAVPWNDGVVFATISHESQAVSMILTGVISLIIYTVLKRKIQPK